MLKALKFVSILIIFLVLIVLIFVWLSYRDRSMALDMARAEIKRILDNPEEKNKLGVPIDSVLTSQNPVDTDLFEKTWIFVYELKPNGGLEVRIFASRGFSFLPVLNTTKTLRISDISYYP